MILFPWFFVIHICLKNIFIITKRLGYPSSAEWPGCFEDIYFFCLLLIIVFPLNTFSDNVLSSQTQSLYISSLSLSLSGRDS